MNVTPQSFHTPVKINLATIARFFVIGIEAGICSDDEARAWSFAVIAALENPPGEIIELSWNKPRPSLREDLKAVKGIAELEQVGHWLLGSLSVGNSPETGFWPLLRSAKHIVNATDLGKSLYYDLDIVADEYELAERKIFGTTAEARHSFDALLAEFAPPPFANGWAGIIFEPDNL